MRCCEIVPSLEEQYGGPSKSVLALSRALAALGDDVELLATHPSTASEAHEGRFRQRIFPRGRPGSLCPSRALADHLRTLSCDVVHHHALWLRTLHYARQRAAQTAVPLVISPRGMMSDWAWHHHAWRKRLARHLVHPGAFEAAAGWHATSREEAEEIRALGFQQPICVAPNGVPAPSETDRAAAATRWRQICPDVATRSTALFYSRLHQKKRVLELIDLWLAVAPADWLLLLVGVPEDYTPRQLETYVMRASGAGRVRVFDGQGLPPPYAVAQLFLLPSHNENFGLVIAEALANRLPVVVTDTTPWSELNTIGAGWCVPWAGYAEALRAALREDPDARAARGATAHRHVLDHYSWEQSAKTLRSFYAQLNPAAPAA